MTIRSFCLWLCLGFVASEVPIIDDLKQTGYALVAPQQSSVELLSTSISDQKSNADQRRSRSGRGSGAARLQQQQQKELASLAPPTDPEQMLNTLYHALLSVPPSRATQASARAERTARQRQQRNDHSELLAATSQASAPFLAPVYAVPPAELTRLRDRALVTSSSTETDSWGPVDVSVSSAGLDLDLTLGLSTTTTTTTTVGKAAAAAEVITHKRDSPLVIVQTRDINSAAEEDVDFRLKYIPFAVIDREGRIAVLAPKDKVFTAPIAVTPSGGAPAASSSPIENNAQLPDASEQTSGPLVQPKFLPVEARWPGNLPPEYGYRSSPYGGAASVGPYPPFVQPMRQFFTSNGASASGVENHHPPAFLARRIQAAGQQVQSENDEYFIPSGQQTSENKKD